MDSSWVPGPSARDASKDQEITAWKPWVLPLESNSTYASSYLPWKTTRTQTCKPKVERNANPAAFNARSTAQDSFLPFDRDYRRSNCKPPPSQLVGGAFESSTTSGDAYRAWGVAKTPSMKPAQARLSTAPFFGRSTAQDAFMAHPSHERTQPFYPKENVSEPSPFDAVSTMSASFLPWPLPRAAGPMKRAKGELDLGWSRALPTGTTVHRDAFTELRLPPGCKATLGVQVVTRG
jgi:hypothetical protein